MAHMNDHRLVFWRDVPVIYQDRKGNRYYGSVPAASYNMQTKRFEPVDNPRGMAYAARTRMRYRRKPMV